MTCAPHDVVRLLAQAVENCAQPHRMCLEVPSSTPVPEVMCDSERILQVVDNLVENALKFSGPEESVVLRVDEEADACRITVVDKSSGIGPEELERLFDFAHRLADA